MKADFEKQLNDYYRDLENRWICVYAELDHRVFTLQSEYRGKHSCFDASGNRVTAEYPLPYVEIEGYCEFQVEAECLSCFTKLRAGNASVLDKEELRAYPFDVWGDDDYYTLLYRSGRDTVSMAEAAADSDEEHLIVHFRLPLDLESGAIYTFAKLLRKRGFFI